MASKEAQAKWRARKRSGLIKRCLDCGKRLRAESRELCQQCWFKIPEGVAYNQDRKIRNASKIDVVQEVLAIISKFDKPFSINDFSQFEVIPGFGFAQYCNRRETCIIQALVVVPEHWRNGWGRLLFYRVLCWAIENHQSTIIAKCPKDCQSNQFFEKLGFVWSETKHKTNTWQYSIQLPLLFYCGGGGASEYDRIATEVGWRLGLRSAGLNKAHEHMAMVDNDWKNYNHQAHLEMVQTNKPLIATARDIEDINHLPEILKQTRELAKYVGRVILIPKVKCWLPDNYWLGYSVPTSFGGTNIEPEWFGNRPVHLLGGSPDAQARYYKSLKNVVSLDGNYAMQLAEYGKAAYQGASSGIPTGKGCYESMRISFREQKKYWHEPKEFLQLSLF